MEVDGCRGGEDVAGDEAEDAADDGDDGGFEADDGEDLLAGGAEGAHDGDFLVAAGDAVVDADEDRDGADDGDQRGDGDQERKAVGRGRRPKNSPHDGGGVDGDCVGEVAEAQLDLQHGGGRIWTARGWRRFPIVAGELEVMVSSGLIV